MNQTLIDSDTSPIAHFHISDHHSAHSSSFYCQFIYINAAVTTPLDALYFTATANFRHPHHSKTLRCDFTSSDYFCRSFFFFCQDYINSNFY